MHAIALDENQTYLATHASQSLEVRDSAGILLGHFVPRDATSGPQPTTPQRGHSHRASSISTAMATSSEVGWFPNWQDWQAPRNELPELPETD